MPRRAVKAKENGETAHPDYESWPLLPETWWRDRDAVAAALFDAGGALGLKPIQQLLLQSFVPGLGVQDEVWVRLEQGAAPLSRSIGVSERHVQQALEDLASEERQPRLAYLEDVDVEGFPYARDLVLTPLFRLLRTRTQLHPDGPGAQAALKRAEALREQERVEGLKARMDRVRRAAVARGLMKPR